MTLQEVWSLLNLYNSSFSGEQIDEAIGVILNGGISAAVEAAQASADAAAKSASEAAGSAASVGAAATNAQSAASRASGSATEAESYAHGGTGTREGEDEDNAKYYAALTEAFVAALNAAAIDGRGHLVFIAPDGSTRDLGDVTGEDGSSIQSITRTAGNGAPGTTDTYTVTLTDGSKTQFQVYNGKDGMGTGDMTAAVYDPQGKAQDIFAYVENAASKFVAIAIPAGRMRGDIDGDGKFTQADVDLLDGHNNETAPLTDPTQLLAADVNNDGKVNTRDKTLGLKKLLDGTAVVGQFGEITGNWTVNPNYATEDAQFYADIPVAGMTASSSATVSVKGDIGNIVFSAECLDDAIRVYATLCPIAELKAVVQYGVGDGSAIVLCESACVYVTVDEMNAAIAKAIEEALQQTV